MQTTLGGSKLSFLALAVSLTVYATLSAIAFIKSANPGPDSTGIKQTAIQYKFTLDTELYSLLQNMDKSLKQQLLGGVVEIYVRPLKDKYVIYGNLTCLEVIDHLKENYCKIT